MTLLWGWPLAEGMAQSFDCTEQAKFLIQKEYADCKSLERKSKYTSESLCMHSLQAIWP